VASDYLGRPEADVRSDLEGLGLAVTVTSSEGGGQVGTVKHVSPTGTLDAGSRVTIEVVARPQPKPGKADKPGPDKPHKPKKKGH
jgi:hypothetical protein